MAAFFFPEVHRKSDFAWSGVGLFYALILWVCAGRITGAVLLGQIASVALLGWFAWQTLTLRRELTPVAGQTPIPSLDMAGKSTGFKGLGSIADFFGNKKDKIQKKNTTEGTPSATVTKTSEYAAITTLAGMAAAEEGAIASSPETETNLQAVANAEEIGVVTFGDIANASTKDVLADNSPDAIAKEVVDPSETSQVELPTVSKEVIAPAASQTLPDNDGFDEVEDFAEITQKQQVTLSSAAKPKRSPADFGSLLAKLKNSLASLGGFGKAKTKPVETTKETKTSIAETGIPIYPTADIDDILESNSVKSVPEVVPQTFISLTQTSSPMATETIEETVRSPGEITEAITTENLTAAVDALEIAAPTPPVEIAEMVAETPTETLSVGERR